MTETWLKERTAEILTGLRPRVWWFKVHGHPYQRAGVPDILLCVDGRLAALELKRPGSRERPSPAQLVQLRAIHAAGGWTAVLNDLDLIREWLHGLLEAPADLDRKIGW